MLLILLKYIRCASLAQKLWKRRVKRFYDMTMTSSGSAGHGELVESELHITRKLESLNGSWFFDSKSYEKHSSSGTWTVCLQMILKFRDLNYLVHQCLSIYFSVNQQQWNVNDPVHRPMMKGASLQIYVYRSIFVLCFLGRLCIVFSNYDMLCA